MKYVPSIRSAQPEDADCLQLLDVKCFEHTWLPRDWKNLWGNDSSEIFVGCLSVTPISFAACELSDLDGIPILHVYKVGVLPMYRGSNIGKHLLAAAYDIGVKAKVKYLTIPIPESLTCGEPPKNCIGWLKKMGFKSNRIMDDKEIMYGQKEDVYLFTYEL